MQETEAHSTILSRKDFSALKEPKANIEIILESTGNQVVKFHQDSISSSSSSFFFFFSLCISASFFTLAVESILYYIVELADESLTCTILYCWH